MSSSLKITTSFTSGFFFFFFFSKVQIQDVDQIAPKKIVKISYLKTLFLIGNQRTIINEKKWKVQVVHDDEQQETYEMNSKTKYREISGNVSQANIQSYKDLSNDDITRLRLSLPTSILLFLSCQIVHTTPKGTNFQIIEIL